MRNGVVMLERGCRVWGTWEGMARGLASRGVSGRVRTQSRGFPSAGKCEGCGRAGVGAASFARTRPPRSEVQPPSRPSNRQIQTSTVPQSWHTAPAQPPTAHPDTTIALPEQLRSIMRLLTHSVVVCTSMHETTPRAMTMSSFTSLTLFPAPLITFNVATPSRTLDAISSSGSFNIHILAGDPGGAAIASHFTRGNVGGHVMDGLEGVVCDEEGVLRGEGVLFALRCRVVRDAPEAGLVRVRDHVIVVGEVVEMVPVSGREQFGLAYADRKYRQIGGVLENDE